MESIGTVFDKCNQLYLTCTDSSPDESFILSSIATIEESLDRVIKADLFSVGEELEEYSTQTLKFLCLKYFLAKVHTRQNNLLNRKLFLELSVVHFKDYLRQCASLNILDQDDIYNDDEEEKRKNTDDRRAEKISKYKKEKEAKDRMQSIQRLLLRKNADGDLDCEEETRRLTILQLQSYARDSVDELDMIKQEIVLLDHMASVREEQEQLQNANRNPYDCRMNSQSNENSNRSQTQLSGSHSSSSGGGSRVGGIIGREIQGLPERDFLEDDGHGLGISVIKTSKIGDQIMYSREERVSSVFRPSLCSPTMSLEEFGDQQKVEAEERSRIEQSQESAVVKRYAQLLADGEEDDADLVDKATDQDREWDAWKEENAKGSGNKMGKRY